MRHLIVRFGRVPTVFVVTVASTVLAVIFSGLITLVLEGGYNAASMTESYIISALVAVIVAPIASWYIVGLLIRVHALEMETREQASHDVLTGLLNRRHFVEAAEIELSRAIRYDRPLSVIMLDLDEFKAINDTLGHAVGDQVLMAVGNRITSCLREVDLAGRMGGEEFALVLPETPWEAAAEVAERIVRSIGGHPVDVAGAQVRVTASAGVAEQSADDSGALSSFDVALMHADQAMYAAKREGRNRVHAHDAGDEVPTSRWDPDI
jgi:diguanylate cyclase (GGDEF)-like protein